MTTPTQTSFQDYLSQDLEEYEYKTHWIWEKHNASGLLLTCVTAICGSSSEVLCNVAESSEDDHEAKLVMTNSQQCLCEREL